MQIDIFRKIKSAHSTIGELWVDDQFECYVLEPSDTPVHPGHPCITAGTFKVELTFSPKFQFVTPELMGVPNRTDIRIHKGNRPLDSLGCFLVGNAYTTDWVSDSAVSFDRLMTLLKTSATEISVTVHDPAICVSTPVETAFTGLPHAA